MLIYYITFKVRNSYFSFKKNEAENWAHLLGNHPSLDTHGFYRVYMYTWQWYSSKHETLKQCRFNIVQLSATLGQHQTNIAGIPDCILFAASMYHTEL